MQQVSRLFFLLMIDDTTETPTFLTPFLSVNSFQLLWKTCVRWCAWNRVFVSIATLQLLASCLYSTKKRRAQGKLWDRRHQAAGQRRALVTTREFELKFRGWFLLARQTLLACLWKTERYFMTTRVLGPMAEAYETRLEYFPSQLIASFKRQCLWNTDDNWSSSL